MQFYSETCSLRSITEKKSKNKKRLKTIVKATEIPFRHLIYYIKKQNKFSLKMSLRED